MKKFNFESENEYIEYVLDQANNYLDKCRIYGEHENRNGLITNIEKSVESKKWLENIFKNHPAYNGKGQIVLPMEIEREIDADEIRDFADYIEKIGKKYLVKEAEIDGYTYKKARDEKNKLDRYITAINYLGVPDSDVVIKGKPFTEYRQEYNRFDKICDDFEYGDYIYFGYNEYITSESSDLFGKARNLSYVIRNCVGKQLEDEGNIEILSRDFPHSQCRSGAKITRVIQKCLKEIGLYQLAIENEKETYNRMYAAYCDAVSPLKVKKWSVISINFVDYLTMCNGKNWTSCLNTDKNGHFTNGEWASGFNSRRVLDYALDPSTIVFYTIDEDYEGDDFEFQPKNTRQLFHFDEGKLVQSRLYPQSRVSRRNIYTQYREVVEKVLADAMNEANLWSAPTRGTISLYDNIVALPYEYESNGDYIDFLSSACHGYDENDFQDEVNYVVFRGSTNQEDNGVPMTIGSTEAVCIKCGCEMRESHHVSISCCC